MPSQFFGRYRGDETAERYPKPLETFQTPNTTETASSGFREKPFPRQFRLTAALLTSGWQILWLLQGIAWHMRCMIKCDTLKLLGVCI